MILTLVFCIGITAKSQSDSKKERIKYLFSLMHQDSLIIKTFETISSSVVNQMAPVLKDTMYTNAGIDFSEKYEEMMRNSMEAAKESALKLLNEDMVDIYEKYFTLDDIESFIGFYQSKAGQKMITALPDITKDVMNVMTAKYQPAVHQSIMKEIEEMTKKVSNQ